MTKAAIILTNDAFSVKIIFRTLFAPWKRDELSYDNLSLKERFSVFLLNLASRFVGFFVKLATFVTFLIILLVVLSFSIVAFFLWFGFPAIIVLLVILGLSNL